MELAKKQDNPIIIKHINTQNGDWNKNTTILLIDIMSRYHFCFGGFCLGVGSFRKLVEFSKQSQITGY